ncbi:glycosyltransferase domain-containing protein [Dokdonella immobilis]|uniref:TOD1/MUCI70 glycosyltransferase-like domain-containing protein n=1 Tax=Dokdonella immobilis TaxID=578942 RepID=A0A1I4Y148_9GAMM|nr:glycosyltransferase domain-containing protein [Dokdonella immobilis]SFN31765.1 Protein of unknown function [Dokdonella immobilis]
MQLLVYTCVFGGYDRIYPPVEMDPSIDYVAITDDPALNVRGWRPHLVDNSQFSSARIANRFYKMLGHRILTGYDAGIYVDGNVRILGPSSRLLSKFLQTGTAVGLYRHSKRDCVRSEVATCIKMGKVDDARRIEEELNTYLSEGFPDRQGLVEATVLLKNHAHPELDSAMELWWNLYSRYGTRDQISLPYVLWKTGLPHHWNPGSFRDENPYFGVYPHFAALDVSARYAHTRARSYDSRFYLGLLAAWHAKWRIQRYFRARKGQIR